MKVVSGISSSSVDHLTNVNGTLFFVANDGTTGRELWKSDGTVGGTVLVADVSPGADGSWPALISNVDGRLFFAANDEVHGYELWLVPACGDGLVQDGESCDDGNTADGDGCSAACQIEPTPTPTDTTTPTLTATPTPTETLTPAPTQTPMETATPGPTPTATPVLDHFTCYKAGATSGSVKFPGIANPPGVGLGDQFGASTVAVKKPKFLCAPTNKESEDPTAPDHAEHLKGYQIKPAAKRDLPTNLTVKDHLNPAGIPIDAKKESHLLVPTVKSLSTPPPLPGAFVVDHFQCYKAKVSTGAPKFEPVLGVEIEDQFGTMHVDVRKPTFLCNPVDKNGEGILDPVTHLMCYQIKQVKTEPKFPKVVGVLVNNPFGPETLDVRKPSELCVPALKNP